MVPVPDPRSARRRKIGATVAVVAVVGVAGGYGTYAAFSDTTQLDGSATAGTVQLNDQGSDVRTFTVSGLVPGDAPSVCFDVAAPSPENTQALDVALVASDQTTASTPNTALAGALNVGLERVAASDDDYETLDGTDGGPAIVVGRTDSCTLTGTPAVVGDEEVSTIAGLTDSVTIPAGNKVRYRITLSLPSGAGTPNAAQGGTASFRLLWTGTAGS